MDGVIAVGGGTRAGRGVDHAEIDARGGTGFGDGFSGMTSTGDKGCEVSGEGIGKGANSAFEVGKRKEGNCASIPPFIGSSSVGGGGTCRRFSVTASFQLWKRCLCRNTARCSRCSSSGVRSASSESEGKSEMSVVDSVAQLRLSESARICKGKAREVVIRELIRVSERIL